MTVLVDMMMFVGMIGRGITAVNAVIGLCITAVNAVIGLCITAVNAVIGLRITAVNAVIGLCITAVNAMIGRCIMAVHAVIGLGSTAVKATIGRCTMVIFVVNELGILVVQYGKVDDVGRKNVYDTRDPDDRGGWYGPEERSPMPVQWMEGGGGASKAELPELAADSTPLGRHYARALEIEATIPDGTLLLQALEPAVRQVAARDSQAAFRLANSRTQLQIDVLPQHSNVWRFSQCLLAEAETLVLIEAAPMTSPSTTTPIKLKQVTGGDGGGSTAPGPQGETNGKGRGSQADIPCKWFRSDTGCRSGKQCKWSHSWEGITDKNERCWICGAKDHRKNECKLRASPKRTGEGNPGSGGGNVTGTSGTPTTTTSTPTKNNPNSSGPGNQKGKLAKTSASATNPAAGKNQPKVNEMKTDGTGTEAGRAEPEQGEGGSENKDGKDTSAALIQEATQLLRSMRVQPQVQAVRLSGLEHEGDPEWVLLDSGATHGLRPAENFTEWEAAMKTEVLLAEGSTSQLRLKPGTKILLSKPGSNGIILPMGGLTDLGFKVMWSNGCCEVWDDGGEKLEVQVRMGCPMVSRKAGWGILQRLERHQLHVVKKLLLLRSLAYTLSVDLSGKMDEG
eukprot:Skav201890  [mRNA]  locus=scaffold550:694016:697590:+ [translate_table: standard]